jgi:hypothetical protein
MGRRLVILAAACSDPALAIDAPAMPDAYDTARCLVKSDYDTLERALATRGTSPTFKTTLTITLDSGPPGDALVITLNSSTPGTYVLATDRPCFREVCVDLIADTDSNGVPAKVFVAGTGMVTWDTVSVAWFGTAEGVQFYELDVNTNTLVPNGCQTIIDKVTFSTAY